MRRVLLLALILGCGACAKAAPKAELLLVGGRVYTMAWPDPDGDGRPAPSAPHGPDGWAPDADTIAISGERILFVGKRADADSLVDPGNTTLFDLHGATVLPGLIESHAHLANLGASLDRVNLVGVQTEAEAVRRVVSKSAYVPNGEWIVGWGWDEGAWTSHLPTMDLLSAEVPNHPVILHGLHTFAVWGNRMAFQRAGITETTPAPPGGEIKKDAKGRPTGILLNNASELLTRAVPPPTSSQIQDRVSSALRAMLNAGYTAVDEAGADAGLMRALDDLDRTDQLALPVYAMIAARDTELADEWRARKPPVTRTRLTVRSVKAFYDGAMGSRGALFLEPYTDKPDTRGVGGAEYGFDRDRLGAMMQAGYQVAIHAIGDRANREALDFFQSVIDASPAARDTRPRIEHVQVIAPADLPRFKALGVIASMQPSHAVEDMAWAEARIGPERVKGAYAWRSLRQAGARMALNSDLPATDYSIFYGLHSAVTRTDRQGKPAGGWHPEQKLTIEEAVRGWTAWAAYADFRDDEAGAIAAGKLANLTVLDIDPFQLADKDPARLLAGKILMTFLKGVRSVPAR